MADNKETFLTYKGKPLVRNGNTVYYGNMADPFVVMLQIKSSKEIKDISVSEDVLVQLLSTDPDLRPKDKIIKKSEKKGFYTALDLGAVWLERALRPSKN